ncbi:hypothetical protein [Haloechinothrix sp. LS1_15]|uniref:hypothetical protein n=1 Tax=Haloechinothrix sp. LS1_15 TaxID=2652248 RepID=UPI002944F6CE|nr:hypothetical protein [Haloechinothrix sp. LS1_15]MDV6011323.1 hypothetical protein [Haloechinothrix sp. LS1_15]
MEMLDALYLALAVLACVALGLLVVSWVFWGLSQLAEERRARRINRMILVRMGAVLSASGGGRPDRTAAAGHSVGPRAPYPPSREGARAGHRWEGRPWLAC